MSEPAPSNAPAVSAREPRVMLVITSSDVGGAETIVRELAFGLERERISTITCSLRPLGRVAQELAAAGKTVFSLDMAERPRPLELVTGAVRLRRLLDAHDVDVAHSFLYRANLLTRIAGRLARRRPLIISGHHSLTPLGGPSSTWSSRLTRTLSDRMVAASEAVRTELIRTERVRPDAVTVIPNGVDTTRFGTCAAAPLRRDLGIPAGTLVLGAVGRLSPEKGLTYLLQSMALLADGTPPVHLVIVGDGPERHALEQEVEHRGLQPRVTFLGVSRNLPPLYAAMDLFVLPSIEEAAPTVLLEAMASGRPIVATRVGGALEMVEHDRSGLLVEPRSPHTLAAAISRLAADRVLCERLGHAARQRAVREFDRELMITRHAALYRSLLHRHPRGTDTAS